MIKDNSRKSEFLVEPIEEHKHLFPENLQRMDDNWSKVLVYKSDTNILDNAGPHLKNRYLLKMDFRDFFPSIRAQDFVRYLLGSGIVQDEAEANLLARIFFKYCDGELCLSIGSPGSPVISNALLFPFDENISDICQKNISYRRVSYFFFLVAAITDIFFHF